MGLLRTFEGIKQRVYQTTSEPANQLRQHRVCEIGIGAIGRRAALGVSGKIFHVRIHRGESDRRERDPRQREIFSLTVVLSEQSGDRVSTKNTQTSNGAGCWENKSCSGTICRSIAPKRTVSNDFYLRDRRRAITDPSDPYEISEDLNMKNNLISNTVAVSFRVL